MKPYSASNSIPFPTWAKCRDDSWIYVGWIKNPPACDLFGDMIKKHLNLVIEKKRS